MTDIKNELITEEEYDLMLDLIDKAFVTKHFRIYGELKKEITDEHYDELWYFMPDYNLIFKKEDESDKDKPSEFRSIAHRYSQGEVTLVHYPFGGQYELFDEEVNE